MTKSDLRGKAFHWWRILIYLLSAAVARTNARSSATDPLVRLAFAATHDLSDRMNEAGNTNQVVTVKPTQLLDSIAFDASKQTLWNSCLPQRLVASGGTWVANHGTDLESVSHVEIARPGRGRIQLFCRDPLDDKCSAAAVRLADGAIQILIEEKSQSSRPKNAVIVSFAAMDRRLVEKIQASLREKYDVKSSWESPCGMWIYTKDTIGDTGRVLPRLSELPRNAILRPLVREDAELVESRWEYRSEESLSMIEKMIAASGSTFGGCYGMEIDGALAAWICRYLDGSLGMLWTEEKHRRKGYGAIVVNAAVQSIVQRRKEGRQRPLIAFTVDTNDASQGLLTKLNWKRVADADWVGFSLVVRTD